MAPALHATEFVPDRSAVMTLKIEASVSLGEFIREHPLKNDTGANRRSDGMAQLRLSRMLRVGSNNITRRFRSSLHNAR